MKTQLVPDFGGQFPPIFGQEKDEFLAMTVRIVSDVDSLNHFYIRLCVKIFNQFFFCLVKTLLKYIFIITSKIICRAH